MISRDAIVAEALTWLNTPFHDMAAVKGVGVDCAYMCAAVALATGCIDQMPRPRYSTERQFHISDEFGWELMEKFGAIKVDRPPKKGDIVTFHFARVSCHLGIMISDTQFIHAHKQIGRVVVNNLDGDYAARLTRVYQFPRVED